MVSTLTFGFAAEVLLNFDASVPGSVLCLTCASAVCSLYTTVYSVLEFYYVAMLTAGDLKSQYVEETGVKGLRSHVQRRQELDDLARRVDAMTSTACGKFYPNID